MISQKRVLARRLDVVGLLINRPHRNAFTADQLLEPVAGEFQGKQLSREVEHRKFEIRGIVAFRVTELGEAQCLTWPFPEHRLDSLKERRFTGTAGSETAQGGIEP